MLTSGSFFFKIALIHLMSFARMRVFFLGVIFLLLAEGIASAKQMALIVNKGNAVQDLTAEDVAKIFKCGTRKWANGAPVTIVIRDPVSPEMELLLSRIYKITPEEMKAFIAQHREAIVIVDSNQAMLSAVQSMPGAVGLIDVFLINQEVRVVKIDGKLPVEFGYILRGN